MEFYATADLPARSRIAGWHDLYARHLEPVDFAIGLPERFDARMASGDLGPLRVARLSASDVAIERNAAQVAACRQRGYTFFLMMRGTASLSHFGHSAELGAGDLVLCDGGAPYTLTLGEDCELLALRVAANLLKEHLPSPECFCGRPLSAREGLTSTATAMATSLFGQLEAGLALHYQDRVARHLLDMFATSYAMGFDSGMSGSSIVSGRHATVKLYIEQHLRDPDLSPCSIAQRLKLSSRYVRMIFAASNETVSAYILRRRLEECARQIADPSWRGHSMTEIAFAWGFNSAPHFTRSFRGRYDMSPRDYRRLKLAEGNPIFRRPRDQAAMPAAQAA